MDGSLGCAVQRSSKFVMESRKTYNFEFSDFYSLWLELWVKLWVSEIDEVNLATAGHLASFFRQCTLTIRIHLLILENLFLPGCPFPPEEPGKVTVS